MRAGERVSSAIGAWRGTGPRATVVGAWFTREGQALALRLGTVGTEENCKTKCLSLISTNFTFFAKRVIISAIGV